MPVWKESITPLKRELTENKRGSKSVKLEFANCNHNKKAL